MSGTKFMVIKFRELLRTAIFAVLGVVLIIALINFISSFSSKNDISYVPGTYSTQIELNGDVMDVAVTVKKNKIQSVTLSHTSETIPVFYPLFESTAEEISKAIVKEQSLEVEIPEGAEVTGRTILGAVSECLNDAAVK